ncbi:Zinc finger, UBR-type [Dillenia turbinata]|uniref:Zinc finger, UBR-type n=1 Tax=Dillenia turbinata TaxID=194707 RepID=A0AAN8WDN6_9MAGN
MADVSEEEEAEQTISINEYLKEVEDQELEADLVLGGDEGKECTYTNGYMKRQAIFSCLTCTPDGNAGVCTACSLSCHDGHEIVELWTKRNFRCDCGNSKFGEFFCKLFPDKEVENVGNSYNHNFKGSYCTCGRPYPDPDVEEQVEMIQCCICEDWFHEEHLGLESLDEIPRDEEGDPLYEDLICQICAVVCSFLILYPPTIWAVRKQHDATAESVKGKDLVKDVPSDCGSSGVHDDDDSSFKVPTVNVAIPDGVSESMSAGEGLLAGEKLEQVKIPKGCSQDVKISNNCVLQVNLLVAPPVTERKKAVFLTKNWREMLCRCENCIDFYAQKGISFLLDKEDSIAEYEQMAKQKREEKLQQEQGMELNFLSKLGHVEKMEFLSGIADMKNEIRSFLESFDSSKPITSADIHQVFDNLAKKRKRV